MDDLPITKRQSDMAPVTVFIIEGSRAVVEDVCPSRRNTLVFPRTLRVCCFLSRRPLPVKHDVVSKLIGILDEQIAPKCIIGGA